MDKELVEAFIAEMKQDKEWAERWEENHIQFEHYFKYSGEVEPTQVLITHYRYNHERKCNEIKEKFIKIEDYEKNTKNSGSFFKNTEANYWEETNDGVWSD
tara:strand:- start:7224 stop:7526 length:303 start_codon:yes stop_codon:yes gene_type:complete